jgi:hypothetical protein
LTALDPVAAKRDSAAGEINWARFATHMGKRLGLRV